MPLSETIRGFREILEGKHDDVPESYFLNAGSIDDVTARMILGGVKWQQTIFLI